MIRKRGLFADCFGRSIVADALFRFGKSSRKRVPKLRHPRHARGVAERNPIYHQLKAIARELAAAIVSGLLTILELQRASRM